MAAGARRHPQHTQFVFPHHDLWAHAGHAAVAVDRAQSCFQLVWNVTYDLTAGRHYLQAVASAVPVEGDAVPAEEHAVPAEGHAVPAEEHTVHADGHAVHAEG